MEEVGFVSRLKYLKWFEDKSCFTVLQKVKKKKKVKLDSVPKKGKEFITPLPER